LREGVDILRGGWGGVNFAEEGGFFSRGGDFAARRGGGFAGVVAKPKCS
jgi:hypothetical protein